MFRPISFWLTFHRGGMTPMRRLLSPGGSERCSSTVSVQGSEETPLCPMGWAGKIDAHTDLHYLLRTHTLSCTLHTLGGLSPLSRKFWRVQLLSVREWQVYSRFQQAHRGEAGRQSSRITNRVKAACWTKWAASVCLSLSPSGLFRWAVLPLAGCLHIIKVPPFSSLLSPLRSEALIVLRWKERQFLVKHERRKAVLRGGRSGILQTVRKTLWFMWRGAVRLVLESSFDKLHVHTLTQTTFWKKYIHTLA